MNQLNTLNDDETTDTPREWNRPPPSFYVKYWTYPPKTSTVILATTGRLNNYSVDNGDAEV